MWMFSSRQADFKRSEVKLWLGWEVRGDPISGDYTPDEMTSAELWSIWRSQYPDDRLDIYWRVRGDNVAEAAPFSEGNREHFLTFFTWPVDPEGTPLRWTDLPVADKFWDADHADKGGFIQQHSGWKPSPFQQQMDVTLLERILSGSES